MLDVRKVSANIKGFKDGVIFLLLSEFTSHGAEIPGSLVSEPKHRDSRVRNRNRLGIGTDISAQVVPESEPKFHLR